MHALGVIRTQATGNAVADANGSKIDQPAQEAFQQLGCALVVLAARMPDGLIMTLADDLLSILQWRDEHEARTQEDLRRHSSAPGG